MLITGAGPIGLLTLLVASALGATQITVTDVFPQRLAMASKLGATRTINSAQETLTATDLRADVLIECSGNQTALHDGIRSLRPAGTVVAVGMNPGEDVSVPMSFIQNHEITLTGTFRYANTYPAAIELAASGHYALEDTEDALQATRRDPANIKAIVVPGSRHK